MPPRHESAYTFGRGRPNSGRMRAKSSGHLRPRSAQHRSEPGRLRRMRAQLRPKSGRTRPTSPHRTRPDSAPDGPHVGQVAACLGVVLGLRLLFGLTVLLVVICPRTVITALMCGSIMTDCLLVFSWPSIVKCLFCLFLVLMDVFRQFTGEESTKALRRQALRRRGPG